MLSRLSIRNYALIEQSELEFKNGFTVITGETGAGKSILLEAFSLVLGSRANYDSIRHGQEKCVVEATFSSFSELVEHFLEENGLDNLSELILRRELLRTGRSRAFVNDSPVSLATLKQVGVLLVDIHGQSENLELLSTEYQVEKLDLFAGNLNNLDLYKQSYRSLQSLGKQIEQMKDAAAQVRRDQDYFQFQFDELQEASLDGDGALKAEEEFNQLEHAEDIKRALSTVKDALGSEDQGAQQAIKIAVSSMNSIAELSQQFKDLQSRLQSILIEMDDVEMETDGLASNLEANPARMEEVRTILDDLNRLMHKHNVGSVEELMSVKDEYKLKLEGIESYDSELSALEAKEAELRIACNKLADELNSSRKEHSIVFGEKIVSQVRELGMPKAHLIVDVQKGDRLGQRGWDTVQFMFNANGSDFLIPLNKVASGREVARLTLAIKGVLNESDATPTLVFDEIDTGVSGEVAKRIGTLMRKLSANYQLISVTHLPGVAAKGEHHIKIKKIEEQDKSISRLLELTGDERVSEIASMFSGNELNESALDSAKSLLGLN
ncbi:MAG: DNA repair protein RecN [Bacteroidetes bacterium]|nr:DNA repair protein RecN [Bacteroidota bacterium]